jgi:hypothetical protein
MPPVVHGSLDPPACELARVLRAIVTALLDVLLVMTLRSRPDQRLDTPACGPRWVTTCWAG